MASRVASTSRQVFRSIAKSRSFTSDVRLRAPAQELVPPPRVPSSSSGQTWFQGSSGSDKRKGKQRDDFLEEPAAAGDARPGQKTTEQEGVPVIASEGAKSESGGSQEGESDDALPVQQIMSSDMDPHKIPGGSRSATEVLMSLEPYDHRGGGGHHHHHQNQDGQSRRHNGPLPGVPLPHPHAVMDALPLRHPFNTAKFVSALEEAQFDRSVSEAFMRATKYMLISEQERSLSNLVGKQDLENQAYLFKAALDELQTEVQVQCRNDSIALRSANGQLQREIDAFSQKLREDIHDIKNE